MDQPEGMALIRLRILSPAKQSPYTLDEDTFAITRSNAKP